MIKVEDSKVKVFVGREPLVVSLGYIENPDMRNILNIADGNVSSVSVYFNKSEDVDIFIDKLKTIKNDIRKQERKLAKKDKTKDV